MNSNEGKNKGRASHSNLAFLQVCVELRYELSQALLKKDEVERELRDVSTKTGRQTEKAAQVGGSQDFLEQFNNLSSRVPASGVSNVASGIALKTK